MKVLLIFFFKALFSSLSQSWSLVSRLRELMFELIGNLAFGASHSVVTGGHHQMLWNWDDENKVQSEARLLFKSQHHSESKVLIRCPKE